jgi:hypothetical protein
VVGSFGDEVKPASMYTWLQRNPAAKWAVSAAAVVLAGAVLIGTRVLRTT